MAKHYMTLLFFSALLALATATPPLASAFSSPLPRPTLDPAWVCKQLNNCPLPAPRKHRPHLPAYIILPTPASTPEPNHLIRLP